MLYGLFLWILVGQIGCSLFKRNMKHKIICKSNVCILKTFDLHNIALNLLLFFTEKVIISVLFIKSFTFFCTFVPC